MPPKRLRLFAGPNGSGKTTILERIPKELNFGEDVELHCKTDEVPNWFIKYVINRATGYN